MTVRRILCEGPEDIAALREIATRHFGAKPERGGGPSGAGQERAVTLTLANGSKVMASTAKGAKSALAPALAEFLEGLPPLAGDPSPDRYSRVLVLFDPDADSIGTFCDGLEDAVRITKWTLHPLTSGRPGRGWWARRDPGERLLVEARAWSTTGDVLDGLADEQNLERVLCQVLARAYPDDVEWVAARLDEIRQRRDKVPRWKAAVHLWCALVDDKADELSAPARFLGQHKACKPHVRDVLETGGVLRDLRGVLGRPTA